MTNRLRLWRRNKPLKGEPWTWQRGEINPQRSAAEVVEVVRNGVDGAAVEWEFHRNDEAD